MAAVGRKGEETGVVLIMPVSVVVAVMVITVVVAFADSQSAVTQSGWRRAAMSSFAGYPVAARVARG